MSLNGNSNCRSSFGFLIVSYIAEAIFIAIKLPVYFRKGIPLFRKYIEYSYKPRIDEYLINGISNQDISLFISLIDFKKISDFEIAFCEEKRGHFFYYPPIMRGIIRVHEIDKRLFVTGYLNLYVISTIFILVIFSKYDILILFILICCLILKLQYHLYNKIFKFLNRKYD